MQDGSNTEKLSTASGRQLKTKFQVQFSYNFHTNKQTVHLGHDLRSRLCFIENENINLPFRNLFATHSFMFWSFLQSRKILIRKLKWKFFAQMFRLFNE